jgi:hypothetical protein
MIDTLGHPSVAEVLPCLTPICWLLAPDLAAEFVVQIQLTTIASPAAPEDLQARFMIPEQARGV